MTQIKQATAAVLQNEKLAAVGRLASTITSRLLGASVTAMLQYVLLVQVAVPTTMTLIQVAAGRMEAFWKYSQVSSGPAVRCPADRRGR